MTKNSITSALLIIGDEILSGRTEDKNINFIAKNLTEMGINLREVRVVADIEEEIISAVNSLRNKFDYVFTSGGIGPTHDDITSESVAKAFNDIFEKNLTAEQILIQHYGAENINEARLKMAYMPRSATLLENSISSAPGFIIGNVFVMAGIPKIFQVMFEVAKSQLKVGEKIKSIEIKITLTESVIARPLTEIQKKYSAVSMGSYPFDGGTSLVFRSSNYQLLEESSSEMIKILKSIKDDAILSIKS
ncbi:MAG: competence/damage-inducible protein A [Rickettsiales bacterium]|nr:competence/damage-inducible protein A [Rickettsiales bacterium]